MQLKVKKARRDIALDPVSTRNMILSKSLELINAGGMVDFRIDALATALGLSPGNITYHFSRKEDICVALWEECLKEYDDIQRTITALLDLKQVYLIDRVVMQLNYKYRGVLIFRSADLGAMTRDYQSGRINFDVHMKFVQKVLQLLHMNGYLTAGEDKTSSLHEEIIKQHHYMMMRWSINFEYLLYPVAEVEAHLDHMALLCLHIMFPIFTEKGKKEFAEIAEIVELGKLVP